jgi:hypothetical protein
VIDDVTDTGHRYLRFADQQAHGSSPSFEAWARMVADDDDLLRQLVTLPEPKRQPNLVFAALRRHGAEPGDEASLHHGLGEGWPDVRRTILARSTQTNEPARCAVLLPLLHRIPGPIALIELGSSAGLTLIPDRYSYRYSEGTAIDPESGASDVVLECRLAGGSLPPDLALPRIAWRAGIDLNPLDAGDADTADWLTTLVWPEHAHRRDRLARALPLAAAAGLRIERGDLRTGLAGLLAEVPAGTTPVVTHSSVLAYLSADDRASVTRTLAESEARWISLEGRGLVPLTRSVPGPAGPDTLMVAALDGEPVALAGGHGDVMSLLES